MTMNWTGLWMDLFGTATLWGLDMGFWVSLALVALLAVGMNLVFWNLKPRRPM